MTIHITDIQDVTPVDDLPTQLAAIEYRFVMGQAKILFDFRVGVAADIFGHGSKEHCATIDWARALYARTQTDAAADRDRRAHDIRAAIARAA